MQTTTPDRRRAARRQPTQGTTCTLLSPSGETIAVALVWNISTSGVSMLLAVKLDAGNELRGELCPAHSENNLQVDLRVTHVSKIRTGDYFLGAQFRKPISQEQMTPFLN